MRAHIKGKSYQVLAARDLTFLATKGQQFPEGRIDLWSFILPSIYSESSFYYKICPVDAETLVRECSDLQTNLGEIGKYPSLGYFHWRQYMLELPGIHGLHSLPAAPEWSWGLFCVPEGIASYLSLWLGH